MNEAINTLLQASPPLLLALAINLLLYALKRMPWYPNEYLPITAVVVGAAVYPWIADATNVVANVRSPLAYSVVLGAAIGGLSVAMHQQVRQFLGLGTGNTQFTTKPEEPPKQP